MAVFKAETRFPVSRLACLRLAKDDSPAAWVFKWAKEPQCRGRGSPGDLGEGGFWEDRGSPAFDSA